MQCERCGELMPLGAETAHNGRFLCRECYLDVLSPSGVSEAWTRHSSRRLPNKLQAQILDFLFKRSASLAELAAGLKFEAADLDRELSALQEMEMVRVARKDGTKVFRRVEKSFLT